MNRLVGRGLIATLIAGGFLAPGAEAVVPDENSALAHKVVRHPGLHIPTALQPATALRDELGARVRRDLAAMGVSADSAFYDARAARVTSFILSAPLVPGSGTRNTLAGTRPQADDAGREAVWHAVRRFLRDRQATLRINMAELGVPSISILEHGNLIHVVAPRVLGTIPVRDSSVTLVLNHGNVVLLGLQNWGDAASAAPPAFSETQARLRVVDHVKPFEVEVIEGSHLEYVPMADGERYDYRLVWVVQSRVVGDLGTWEALVDAGSGELLAFEDKNQYASRRVMGGVYPYANDQRWPDGVEQAGWPLPFADVTIDANTVFANSGGSFGCFAGNATTTLTGQFVGISDVCGAVNETAATDLDLGFGPTAAATDCVVPPGHSAGDTKAARTTFYHLNRINEQGRGYLPGNSWLQSRLTANTNIVQSCNAFWNGTVGFYRNGGGCGNTGEIEGNIDHEWGHGMDNNGTNASISRPGEGIADIYATLHANNSCIGRGFLLGQVCGGYGDPCIGTPTTGCTGFRDADFAQHASGLAHDIAWIKSACFPLGLPGPCNREAHCEGQVVSEIGWDLHARDLRAAPFNLDSNTALELTTRLFYLGAGLVTDWYTCTAGCETTGTCGCGATGGYLQVLAADDDDGNINNGTPHMLAIHAAFNRHQMACSTVAPVVAGCASGPVGAPSVTATPGLESVALGWTPVSGASRYFVYRAEGVSACDSGKAKVGDVTGTSFTDTGLMSGRLYSYIVLPVGSNTACFGSASACAGATPTAVDCATLPYFSLACSPTGLTSLQGGSATSTCTVQSVNGFSSPVTLSCTGLAPDLTCSFNPSVVSPPPNSTASSTLTVTVGGTASPTTSNFRAAAVSGALSHTFGMSMKVEAISATPFALLVDAAGNGVYEPNETVVIAPTWRNDSVGAITLTGTLSVHSGPPGPMYTVPDGAASYATITPGATGSCGANCYTVANEVLARPATHWDSTVVETLSPGTVTKTWTLHIGGTFTDVSQFVPAYPFVETLAHKNVLVGCTGTTYCSGDPTTRAQMALLALVAKYPKGDVPPPCGSTPMFTDVPVTSPFCRWIEELVRRGVAGGCGPGIYCPTASVTREQMPIFILRTLDPALNPPACVTPMFADVPASSPFCRWIEELARRGVVTGCGGGKYCPTDPVTRESMSAFLVAGFGLTLYGP